MCSTMAVVKLPEGVVPSSTNMSPPYNDAAAHVVMNILHFQYKIEVSGRIATVCTYMTVHCNILADSEVPFVNVQ